MRVLASPKGAADRCRLPGCESWAYQTGLVIRQEKSDTLGMSHQIIRVIVEEQPELYEELVSAMMGHGEYEGCDVEQYTEYHENGQTIAKFTLREGDLE